MPEPAIIVLNNTAYKYKYLEYDEGLAKYEVNGIN